MYFGTKSYLKSNYYHTAKHPLQLSPRHGRMVLLKLRERGWIVIVRQVIPTSPLSLWYGTFPREEFSMANVGSRKSECLGLTIDIMHGTLCMENFGAGS
jgi:hypothetical protein